MIIIINIYTHTIIKIIDYNLFYLIIILIFK